MEALLFVAELAFAAKVVVVIESVEFSVLIAEVPVDVAMKVLFDITL